MALIKCKECGEQISNQAKSCPKCGSPLQKKSGSGFLIFLLIIIICGGALYYYKFHDDTNERIAAAKEILKNNRDDIVQLATGKIEKNWVRAVINVAVDQGSECIVDSLAVRLANQYSLDELNDIKIHPATNLLIISKLVTQNEDVCVKCLQLQR
ncbi:MAG: zinc-ribbon domain-containing protein [Bacteroidia bacterium]|jgi:RNA polymerase subunit RPABC4/transcription elongation factor Spt4